MLVGVVSVCMVLLFGAICAAMFEDWVLEGGGEWVLASSSDSSVCIRKQSMHTHTLHPIKEVPEELADSWSLSYSDSSESKSELLVNNYKYTIELAESIRCLAKDHHVSQSQDTVRFQS